ncbi:MAG: TonB-dependent receptor plug domain-containing protein [Candidatus Latescibacteria bacterium]|nr:TonB-dependent receptor plug domain-containing protein [Candidatus Latescibacterota bacterium]
MRIGLVFCLGCWLVGPARAQENFPIDITVVDRLTGIPLPGVRLQRAGSDTTLHTDAAGQATVLLPAGEYVFTGQHSGFHPANWSVRLAAPGLAVRWGLQPVGLEMPEVVATASRIEAVAGQVELSTTQIDDNPSPAPDALRFVKVLPGVTSGNDFSSTYNVQGGNYSENAVYLNGVELAAPLQMRRGRNETLSLVNAALVERITFQAGHFPVFYGDKLSSVLDARYRRPAGKTKGRVAVSSLQQSLNLEGSPRPGLGLLGGIRRADLGRLSRGQQTGGRYRPLFWDAQGMLVWEASKASRLILFGALLRSDFRLQPSAIRLRYNCNGRLQQCDEFSGRAQGSERFAYETEVLALTWERGGPTKGWRALLHWVDQSEDENTALRYQLRWRPCASGSCPGATGPADIEVGEDYRSRLRWRRWEAAWQGQWEQAGQGWDWGLGGRRNRLAGELAGLERFVYQTGVYQLEEGPQARRRRWTDGYAYGRYRRTWGATTLSGGVRGVRPGQTGEYLILPRLQIEWQLRPQWRLWSAVGRYAQPPLYGEYSGASSDGLRSQRAVQLSTGAEYGAAGFSGRAEVYYRNLRQVISYTVDDLRLRYSGANDARAFAAGLNAHMRGQLSRLVGIISYSYLVAREDMAGDGRGYRPRPTDQRHTVSAYVEDQMPLRFKRLISSRFHLRLLYGSGFPHTPKVAGEGDVPVLLDGPANSRRDRGYFRFDVGMTQTVLLWGRAVDIRQEVANMFDQHNTVGHSYLPTPDGTPVELRRSLGRRIYNVRIGVELGSI